jgi:membrane protein involved in colicin uptake
MRFLSGNLSGFAVLLCGVVVGCATQGPKPTEEVTRAQTLIEQADRSGAQRYAAADLQRAHDELNNADKANAEKKYDEARRYAESAAVDANVAQARAAAGEAQRAAQEVRQGNQTLQQESDRGPAPGPSGPQEMSSPQGSGAVGTPPNTANPDPVDSSPHSQNPR